MSVSIQATLQVAPLRELEQTIGKVRFAAAAQQAISEVLRTGRALTARSIGDVVNLRIGSIKETIATKGGGFASLSGSIIVTRKPVPLYEYLTKAQAGRAYSGSVRGGSGIKVKVYKGKEPDEFKESFVRVMRSGHVGVWRRVWAINLSSLSEFEKTWYKAGVLHYKKSRLVDVKNRGGRVSRLPISERFGPTSVGVLTHAKGASGAETILDEVTNDLSDQLIARVMSKAKWLSETDDATTRRLLAKAARVLHEPVE